MPPYCHILDILPPGRSLFSSSTITSYHHRRHSSTFLRHIDNTITASSQTLTLLVSLTRPQEARQILSVVFQRPEGHPIAMQRVQDFPSKLQRRRRRRYACTRSRHFLPLFGSNLHFGLTASASASSLSYSYRPYPDHISPATSTTTSQLQYHRQSFSQ